MRPQRSKSLAFAVSFALVLAAGALACHPAEDPESVRARQAHELARELMSPFCPGRTLAECSSPDAGAVREEIRDELRAGEPPAEIRKKIEARFGDRVVGMPHRALDWALPILVIAAGAVALAFALLRLLQQPRATAAPISPELEQQLARELDDVEPD